MTEIQATARLKIHDGRLQDFRVLAARVMEAVRAQDSGTLQFDWFMSEDQRECVARETYRDSEAFLEHLQNVEELVGELLGLGDLSIEMYGSPSDALLEATAALSPRIYSPFQSL